MPSQAQSVISDALCLRMLAAIAAYHRINHFPPTIREVGSAIDIRSTGHVEFMRGKLARRGWLTYRENSPRSMVVTPAGKRALRVATQEAQHA